MSLFNLFNFLFLLYIYLLLLILSGDIELNPGPNPKHCKILCCNIRGLSGNMPELSVPSQGYDILLCSETLVSSYRNVNELRACVCI